MFRIQRDGEELKNLTAHPVNSSTALLRYQPSVPNICSPSTAGHWSIEYCNRYIRYITFSEDDYGSLTKHVPDNNAL